eukprot:SAG11_NODE_1607_length_4590_cov_2.099978_4_plen_154_part_00
MGASAAVAILVALFGGRAVDAQITQQDDCYMHLELDGQPCNDGNDNTAVDECFQGACGSWTVIGSSIGDDEQAVYQMMSQSHPNVQFSAWRNDADGGTVSVFEPAATEVMIDNVQTTSAMSYVAAPISLNQPYYTDREYVLTDLPGFLKGLYG